MRSRRNAASVEQTQSVGGGGGREEQPELLHGKEGGREEGEGGRERRARTQRSDYFVYPSADSSVLKVHQ